MRAYRRNSYRLQGHDYADPAYAYFATINAKIKRLAYDSPIDIWAPFTSCRSLGQQANDSLLHYRESWQLLIFAYCIMPDHIHVLATPAGGANLSSVLGSYESYVTKTAWGFGVIGKLFQRSYYDIIVRSSRGARAVVAYILNNPVRAGLVTRWQDWPWCGMPDPL